GTRERAHEQLGAGVAIAREVAIGGAQATVPAQTRTGGVCERGYEHEQEHQEQRTASQPHLQADRSRRGAGQAVGPRARTPPPRWSPRGRQGAAQVCGLLPRARKARGTLRRAPYALARSYTPERDPFPALSARPPVPAPRVPAGK